MNVRKLESIERKVGTLDDNEDERLKIFYEAVLSMREKRPFINPKPHVKLLSFVDAIKIINGMA